MTITTLDPHDTSQKTSIAHAIEQGYTITQDGDGSAEIVTPEHNIYHAHEWSCDCPDSLGREGGTYELPDGRKACKHVLWSAQLYPCQCPLCAYINETSTP